ncbi:MAG: N-6 DNA methylase [Comamonadaceae bacterium]|nr:N-6 DNA methylase [Comamonadaceae bacterium]
MQATARVCAMNLMLHGIGSEKSVPVKVADALAADPGERFDVVLANPPFGKKSSTDDRRRGRQDLHREGHRRARRLLGHHQQQAAQLRAAHQDAAQAPRPRRGGGARQRAVRRRRRRDHPPQAAARVRRAHPAAPAHRPVLRAGREGQRALLRQEAGQRDAVDQEALDLRPAHQQALHAEDQPAQARGPGRVRGAATTRPTATSARRPGAPRTRTGAGASTTTTSWWRATRRASTSSGSRTSRLADSRQPAAARAGDRAVQIKLDDLEAALEQFRPIAGDLNGNSAEPLSAESSSRGTRLRDLERHCSGVIAELVRLKRWQFDETVSYALFRRASRRLQPHREPAAWSACRDRAAKAGVAKPRRASRPGGPSAGGARPLGSMDHRAIFDAFPRSLLCRTSGWPRGRPRHDQQPGRGHAAGQAAPGAGPEGRRPADRRDDARGPAAAPGRHLAGRALHARARARVRRGRGRTGAVLAERCPRKRRAARKAPALTRRAAMRVFLDANILFSAAKSDGAVRALLRLAARARA